MSQFLPRARSLARPTRSAVRASYPYDNQSRPRGDAPIGQLGSNQGRQLGSCGKEEVRA
jgi:hypothetical protein